MIGEPEVENGLRIDELPAETAEIGVGDDQGTML
jgi:hypothetical protein